MLLNLEQFKAIDPKSIWFEISTEDLAQAEPNHQDYSNPTAINNARIDRLCLQKIKTWLNEQRISHCPSFDDIELASIWDVVTGSAIEVGNRRLILIPSDNLNQEELRVPQEWVDLPSWAGDYYVAVQVDLDENIMNIWGFASHQALKDMGEYSTTDRTYSLDCDALASNLDILWMAEELAVDPRNSVAELVSLSLDRALELIKVLSKPSAYPPRFAIDFGEWAAILDNLNLRSQLYITRLQRAAIAQAPAPTFSLVNWVQQEFTNALASGWGQSNLQPMILMNPNANSTIERSKLIDLQIDLQRGTTVVLLVGIIPDGERMRVVVQVHPVIGANYLPPQLELSYINPDGIVLQTVTARTNDEYIQLPAFTCQAGMEFNIQLQLQNARSIERFIV
jgi:Protein of unknown function (DUF1822)